MLKKLTFKKRIDEKKNDIMWTIYTDIMGRGVNIFYTKPTDWLMNFASVDAEYIKTERSVKNNIIYKTLLADRVNYSCFVCRMNGRKCKCL